MAKDEKSWEKRLGGGPDKLAVDFVQSLSVDKRLYRYDIAGSIAHAQMLADQKIITKTEFKQIRDGLVEIERQLTEGALELDATYEDVHMAIEKALIDKIGAAGKKLHTGRSRNDQIATDLRLWMRDEIDELKGKITSVQRTFVEQSKKYVKDIMPAYTHLQRAQPVVIAAYLLSFVERFERDYIRFGNCRQLLNASPLGSGAVAGTTLHLYRKSTAKQLGFADICGNSIDAVTDRDFCAEFIFDCALVATHLSQFAADWIIYCSTEFGFIRIADAFCTSSSMMPQKRNPDLLELVRAKSGTVYGDLMATLAILKALPTGYNRDLQQQKVHLFGSADTVRASLDVVEAVVSNSEFDTEKIAATIEEGFADATALAEYLVEKGVAFREAHGIVGLLVADCDKSGRRLSELSLDELKKSCQKIDEDVYGRLGTENVVKNYVTKGAGGPKQARVQIEYWQKVLDRR